MEPEGKEILQEEDENIQENRMSLTGHNILYLIQEQSLK